MKLILISILSAILFFTYAHAEHDPLALLTIDQGQIRGTVMAEFTSPDGYKNLQQITVDCAVPDSIQANEVWTVTNRFISEKEMTSALQAIGQPENGTLVCNQTFSHFSGNWDAPASSDICRTDAGKQAVRIGLAYFDALGIDVDPVPRKLERPNDLEAYLEQTTELYTHVYSDPTSYIERAEEQWKRTHRYETLNPNYTTVYFTVMVDGMRVWPTPAYPIAASVETADFSAYAVNAYVTVSDSGILVEAGTSHIPGVLSRSQRSDYDRSAYASNGLPQFIAAQNWQDALRFALTQGAASNLIGNTETYTIQSEMTNTSVTRHSSNGVITSITPYLYPTSKNTLVPIWYIECASEYADGCRF